MISNEKKTALHSHNSDVLRNLIKYIYHVYRVPAGYGDEFMLCMVSACEKTMFSASKLYFPVS